MPMVQGGRLAAQAAKPAHPNCLKNSVRPERSPAHTTIRSFARSTPTVVISFMSSPFLIRLTAHTSILALRCRTRLTSNQGRGTPLYSLEESVTAWGYAPRAHIAGGVYRDEEFASANPKSQG